jgi:two-component system response regulator FixJ
MHDTLAQQDVPPVVGVIDPDPVARNGLRSLLHGLGIDVSTFDSAESYLLAVNGRHLSCLIVDLLLPGMSGLELLRRLRSAGNDVPVILLADESDVPTAVAAIREGATDFIEKPYVDVAVVKQVQKLLRAPPSAAHA